MKFSCVFAIYIKDALDSNQKLWIQSLSQIIDDLSVVYASAQDVNFDDDIRNVFQAAKKNDSVLTCVQYANHFQKDFALWKRFMLNQASQLRTSDRLLLVNDSCQLVKPLTMSLFDKHASDEFWGLTRNSSGVPPNAYQGQKIRSEATHIQSQFLVFQKRAIEYVIEWFLNVPMDLVTPVHSGPLSIAQELVDRYEIGLSRYMVEVHKLPLVTEYVSKDLNQLHLECNAFTDLAFQQGPALVYLGSPCLKRKRML